MSNSKPLPTLPHMPWHIKEKIVNGSHTVQKLALRQCSKEFNFLVDQTTITYRSLRLEWSRRDNTITIRRVLGDVPGHDVYNDHTTEVQFYPLPNGFLKKNLQDDTVVFVENGDFVGAAVEQFVKILRSPKVFIQSLVVRIRNGDIGDERNNQQSEVIMDKLNESLANLGRLVTARSLTIDTDGDAMNIRRVLPHLQPRTLESLLIHPQFFYGTARGPTLDLSGVIGMEQWKQATELFLDDEFPLEVSKEATAHFARMNCNVRTFDVDDLEHLLSNILKEDGWKYRSVRCRSFEAEPVKQYLSEQKEPSYRVEYVKTRYIIVRDRFECNVTIDGPSREVEIHKLN